MLSPQSGTNGRRGGSEADPHITSKLQREGAETEEDVVLSTVPQLCRVHKAIEFMSCISWCECAMLRL